MSNYKEKILNVLNQVKREGISELIKWLEKSDFFTAPASTKYHNAVSGGLSDHSWSVYSLFCEKLERFGIKMNPDSVAIVGLLHDVNKISKYQLNKNTKKWEWIEQNDYGHGSKSVILLQRFIQLTEEEIMFIYHHMGTYSDNKYSYNKVIEKNPELILLFTADWESSRFLEDR